MKFQELAPNIIRLSFPTKKDLTFTMCRVEEYYEASSPKLRNNVFTWADFLDEFMDDAGNLSYFSFWSGFNIPGDIFNAWATTFKDLSSREMKLIDAVNTLRKNKTGKFYVIAAAEGAASVENHELAHATFYINDAYRQEMLTLNERLPQETRDVLLEKFKDLGYATRVYEDELQAYLATSDFEYMNKRFKLTQDAFEAVHPMYAAVFNKYVLGI